MCFIKSPEAFNLAEIESFLRELFGTILVATSVSAKLAAIRTELSSVVVFL